MPILAATDWLILLIYIFFILMAGFSLRPAITGSSEYQQAGRKLPGWLCGVAFAAAGLGIQAPISLGAMGARYGLTGVPLAIVGGVVAMLFCAIYLVPVYHASKARTLPEYLGMRFDRKTRLLTALLFLIAATAGAAFSLYAAARLFTALHLFDIPMHSAGLDARGTFVLTMAIPAVLVLAYVLLGGLGSSIYTQAMQIFLFAAGFLPAILLGVKQLGWSGVKAAAASAGTIAGDWHGASPSGFGTFVVAVGLGLVIGIVFWCADFRVLQPAMAARDAVSAQRAVLGAAAAWVIVPLLVIVPGVIALGEPTPQTTISVRNENGAIYHEITVVPAEVAAGQGLAPAVMDPSTGKPVLGADGRKQLDSPLAGPHVLVHFLPAGLLGLGIVALLACLMSGISASVTAFSAVFTCDLYATFFEKNASDKRLLLVGRLAAAGVLLVAFYLACGTYVWHWKLEEIALGLLEINAPLLGAILLGVFWKRTTGNGAFAGIAAGFAAALALFAGAQSGWIGVLHMGNKFVVEFWTVVAGLAVSLAVTAAVSTLTAARPAEELAGLVFASAGKKPSKKAKWWKQPKAVAVAILMAAIAVSVLAH